jgi:UDP-N-acetylmuramate dehydrogenase
LEFAGGIPGTVGGAVIMNAGAWGSDIASVIESINLITSLGEQTINRKDLNFGYRCWNDYGKFTGNAVVSDVKFSLNQEEPEKIRAYCRALQGKRKENQPGNYANAGSFFKNPAGESAGRLIEASGFKGTRVGGAMVSEKHANFLVNRGGATAAEVKTLMRRIQDKVKKDSGIDLEPEVHFI